MYERAKTVCFTGHRHLSEPFKDVEERLYSTIKDCIENGAHTFITGGAIGFDTIAAQTVIRLRGEFPHIKLALALPCPPEQQTLKWSAEQKRVYNAIYEQADFMKIVSDRYTNDCMFARNRLMVDRSGIIVSYIRKNSGGSCYTVNYARSQGITRIDI